ncbi:MAG: DegT/DnrJ/EryC1/StrS family aminotransferase [Mariprofundaceae bacterium]|nr:DegT/DnrJ/EryC1/StrS family aminotransferase [Mariprofundaceae bacterium]
MIPHSRPIFDEYFSASVQSVVSSGYTVSGAQARLLEQTIIQHLGCHDAVAVDSGTSALMLAIRTLSMQKNIKRVGIPAYACASLLFAVRAAGCLPVCMDCDDSLRLNADKAWHIAPSLDAVILVHPFGMIEPLVKESWPCPIIEDIAQAAGAMIDAKPVGSFGDVSIASFHATKPWGGAYGGMVMASQAICMQVRAMSNPDLADFTQSYVGHHPLSDIHAALVLCRLERNQQETLQRQQHMLWIDKHLPQSYVQSISNRGIGNAFRYIIRSDGDAEACIQHLHAHGIGAAKPVQKPLNFATDEPCEGAYQAWKDCISLPLLPTMSSHEYQQYEQGLKTCFKH